LHLILVVFLVYRMRRINSPKTRFKRCHFNLRVEMNNYFASTCLWLPQRDGRQMPLVGVAANLYFMFIRGGMSSIAGASIG
jgi:hypothetical protein